jgi:hypothetical protein
MPFALPTTRMLVQWTEEQKLPFEQRKMLQCEFQEDSDGNTKLLLVLADSAILRRATVLLNNQPVFSDSDTTFSIVRYKLSFLGSYERTNRVGIVLVVILHLIACETV